MFPKKIFALSDSPTKGECLKSSLVYQALLFTQELMKLTLCYRESMIWVPRLLQLLLPLTAPCIMITSCFQRLKYFLIKLKYAAVLLLDT